MPNPKMLPKPPPMSKPRVGNATVISKASSSKIDPVLMDRQIATGQAPKPTQGWDQKTDAYTFFTKAPIVGQAGPDIIYNADRLWATVVLLLETAGPVAWGTKSQITPVLSGKGILLQTGVPTRITVGKGSRIYVAATTVNRVSVLVEPLPWLEQITALLTAGAAHK